VSGLSNGATYTFKVAAKNVVGVGVAAVSSPVTVGAPMAPVVTAVGSPGQAKVSWTAPANNGAVVSKYVVSTYLGSVLQLSKTHTLTCSPLPCSPPQTWTVTGLTNGSMYTFKITAANSRGTGPAGSTTIKVGSPTVPGVPTGLHATAGKASATVSWTGPANGSATITAYVVTPYKAGVAQTPIVFNSNATTETVTGLTSGRSYTFKVAARSGAGTGSASAASNTITAS
jgi:large repetitive protein